MSDIHFSQYKKTDKNIKTKRIHFQQICTTRNARRSSLGRREVIAFGNFNCWEEIRAIRK